MTSFPGPTWLVGCGNMAGAMVAGWRAAEVDFTQVTAVRPSGTPVDGVQTVTELPSGPAPALVMLGFKPQKLDEVAPALAERIDPATIILSLLAGVEAASLRARFPVARAVVRAMPNLPVAQRKGVTALYSEDRDITALDTVSALIALLGFAPVVTDEAQFSAIGAVAGSGPAYVARFIDALANAAAERGLDSGLAQTLALETVLGTGWLAAANRGPMDDLVRRVASPRGTTLAGLAVLDAELPSLIGRTLDAAIARGEELAAASRNG